MSTKYTMTICDTNERASNILENFLDNNRKFDAIDIVSGSRFLNNFNKHTVHTINDIPIAKAKFINNNYNIYLMSSFNEEANDLPRKVAYNQNMAEISGIVCMANGSINNKELICRKYDFPLGQSLQEFLVSFYRFMSNKPLGNLIIENMIKDIETNMLSFVIYDKNKNIIYIYNRGDTLYMCNIPGNSIIISSEILPVNTIYPHYSFNKLPGNTSIKIDTKTMYVQYLPINSNIFSYGRNLLIDTNKALVYTENCDMEFFTLLSFLSSKEILDITDLQILYFGFSTDIDKIIFDKINKLKRFLKITGKLPTHIPYNFNNIYSTESELIEEINRRKNEQTDIDNQLDPDKKETLNKKIQFTSVKNDILLKDNSIYDIKKSIFIASNLVSTALERGLGSIYIPNVNRKNNKIVNLVKSIIDNQVNTPLYVYSMFDNFTTVDFIRYLIGCKNYLDLDDKLVNSDRTGIVLEVDDNGKSKLKFNASTDYNNDIFYAFQKCGFENPFEYRYIGKNKINNLLINSGYSQDKVMDNKTKTEFLNSLIMTLKNDIEYQRKIQSF